MECGRDKIRIDARGGAALFGGGVVVEQDGVGFDVAADHAQGFAVGRETPGSDEFFFGEVGELVAGAAAVDGLLPEFADAVDANDVDHGFSVGREMRAGGDVGIWIELVDLRIQAGVERDQHDFLHVGEACAGQFDGGKKRDGFIVRRNSQKIGSDDAVGDGGTGNRLRIAAGQRHAK